MTPKPPPCQTQPSKGRCGHQCRGDSSCPPAQKCCSSGCGQVCAPEFPPAKPKLGICPPIPKRTKGRCVQNCKGDESCPPGRKCCSNGCDHICVPPMKTVIPKRPPCPPPPSGKKGRCDQDCQKDSTCQRKPECCSQGCGQACGPPTKGSFSGTRWPQGKRPIPDGTVVHRPGICPKLPPSPTGKCSQNCRGDYSCPRGHKCCSSGCGQVCAPATTKASGSICEKPVEVGRCMGHMPMYYYNSKKKKCEPFIYGGCQGNENRFKTMDLCKSHCGGSTKSGRCPPPPKGYRGSCYESCKGDQYCPPKHKCCSNGCGRSCKLAVTDNPWISFN
ncbi:WAP four-disulfide core domain protein 3-like isoform X2 [Ornithorhynchus anatinus]|uniref:WAP four-disulfide core domain protein 3-like isoform X2 n=1 Tax=Ornithorhynchus anatinus TaxID=9258 RepID=UPI0010A869E0|nr:WAP four-disulfide core domain protein 3-like isoform X2 [Ornithorhynchus anatinus]XP_039770380.1 WAP four-disulfide core domain protein 3-like isoform X2 [Ornithorhynchus anatinus]